MNQIGSADMLKTSLMLVLPLNLLKCGDRIWLDAQACNGLRLWLENFDKVTLCGPLVEVKILPPMVADPHDLIQNGGLEIVPIPSAWTPHRFFFGLPKAVRILRQVMKRSTHLQFAIGGLWGDWASVAAILALWEKRPAAIWTDRVESEVMLFHSREVSGFRHFYRLTSAYLARYLERFIIRHSAMGLFHGMDTYNVYARYCPKPHLVHDIHLGPEARISMAELDSKIGQSNSAPLRIVYGGRAHPEKGVMDWIEALRILDQAGIEFEAHWLGDGPELDKARARVDHVGLNEKIRFPGIVTDRDALLAKFRKADIFMFCHKTLESPRCLIEALLSGAPIVGYDSPYPRDLIARNGGGVLTPHTPQALADKLVDLARDRPRLAALSRQAAADGHPMVDEEVFHHRSDLIKLLSAHGASSETPS
jgi:glycosyltransferase involved in cell wall biosynthesis